MGYNGQTRIMKKILLVVAMLLCICFGINAQTNAGHENGYVDLGLPSGTLWKAQNESGLYTYEEAIAKFPKNLPSKEEMEELINSCQWTWTGNGHIVKGPNGKSITFTVTDSRSCEGKVYSSGEFGSYWSSTPSNSERGWYLSFSKYSTNPAMIYCSRCHGLPVRLIKKQK